MLEYLFPMVDEDLLDFFGVGGGGLIGAKGFADGYFVEWFAGGAEEV